MVWCGGSRGRNQEGASSVTVGEKQLRSSRTSSQVSHRSAGPALVLDEKAAKECTSRKSKLGAGRAS